MAIPHGPAKPGQVKAYMEKMARALVDGRAQAMQEHAVRVG